MQLRIAVERFSRKCAAHCSVASKAQSDVAPTKCQRSPNINVPVALLLCLLVVTAAISGTSPRVVEAQDAEGAPERATLQLEHALAAKHSGVAERSIIYSEALLSARRGWTSASGAPLLADLSKVKAGDTYKGVTGEDIAWQAVSVNDKGWLQSRELAGAWVIWDVSEAHGKYELHARGHSTLFIGAQSYAGDPYGKGRTRNRLTLAAGSCLLFKVARGRLKATLTPIDEETLSIQPEDSTLPDLVPGDHSDHWGAAVFHSQGEEVLASIEIRTQVFDDEGEIALSAPRATTIASPFAFAEQKRKLKFKVPPMPQGEQGSYKLRVRAFGKITDEKGKEFTTASATHDFSIRVRDRYANRRVTFVSKIDQSVQYYGLREARPLPGMPAPGIVLSLHGASVEGISQSRSYATKTWCHIVAATNRRPFGFDWEDWGRMDAIEVLHHAQSTLTNDSARTYLTGHSMGGHGTWYVGAQHSDEFAAIGPSAGWIDFWSYVAGPEYKSPNAKCLDRASNISRTLLLKQNYRDLGIYILHGDKDDNVPVEQARAMRKELEGWHPDFRWHEEPGKGHWWNKYPSPGADCVDWQPMFDFFARRRKPLLQEVNDIDFTTLNPSTSAHSYWVRVEQQLEPLLPSRIQAQRRPATGRVTIQTSNISIFTIDLEAFRNVAGEDEPQLTLNVDGSEVSVPPAVRPRQELILRKTSEAWVVIPEISHREKHAGRTGGFKSVFGNNVLLVVGSGGDSADQIRNKAIFDAERWLYRGNGSLEMVLDVDFDAAKCAGRNILLYGNADTNSAWAELLPDCPIEVREGSLKLGDKTIESPSIGGVLVYPRPGEANTLVGAVTGTGELGFELMLPARYFVSGAGIPDFVFVDETMLEKGYEGLLSSGFFDNNWKLDSSAYQLRDE